MGAVYILRLWILCFICIGCYAKDQSIKYDRYPSVIKGLFVHNKPSDDFLDLLFLTEVLHNGNLSNIVTGVQKHWLRSVKERWQITGEKYTKNKVGIFQILEKIGYLNDVVASVKQYDNAVILGSSLSSFKERLLHLIYEWNRGVRFKKIIILTGERPLNHDIESRRDILYGSKSLPYNHINISDNLIISNEYEMIKVICKLVKLPIKLQKIPFIFIVSPMKKTINNEFKRPTTTDTILAWRNSKFFPQTKESCLVISNQPYIGYHNAALQYDLRDKLDIETVGAEAINVTVSLCLDSLGRHLWQLNEIIKQKTS